MALNFVNKDMTSHGRGSRTDKDVGFTYSPNKNRGAAVYIVFRNDCYKKIAPNPLAYVYAVSGSRVYFKEADDKTENLKMDVLATYLYRTGFSSKGGNHYGKASAIGVVLVVLCLISTGVINKIFKTENYEM